MGVTTLYLIRHGETAGNLSSIFQGRTDVDLSENGVRQIGQLAARFAEIPLDLVVSSPLIRALRTAKAVKGSKDIPLVTDERLMEINGGEWEGKFWRDLPSLFPKECRDWAENPASFIAPKGEQMTEVYARVSACLTDFAETSPGGRVAVVSHGGAIRNALCFAKGWPVGRIGEVGWCDNTGVSIIEIASNGACRLLLERDTSHLDYPASLSEKNVWWKQVEQKREKQ